MMSLGLTSTRKESSDNSADVNILPDSKRRFADIETRLQSNLAKDVLDIKSLQQQVRDLEEESTMPNFWDDTNAAQSQLSKLNTIKLLLTRVNKWLSGCEDIRALIALTTEFPDTDDARELKVPLGCTSLPSTLIVFDSICLNRRLVDGDCVYA